MVMWFISYIASSDKKGGFMKFLAKVLVLLAVSTTLAQAACPTWKPYGCRPGPNGKQICGCGQGY